MISSRVFLGFFILSLLISSCGEDKIFVPKPRMYPKINFPTDRLYVPLDTFGCQFHFMYPAYSTLERDSFIFDSRTKSDCWFDIEIKDLNTKLYCSYYAIDNENNLSKLINDAFEMAGKHNVRAEFRKESIIEKPGNVNGLLFEISGPVASPIQFYVTDSINHFFRASLYFESHVNPDSTAPVLTFMKQDIFNIIDSFEWE
jgi:gliding motility-associated lipoprotein GldD